MGVNNEFVNYYEILGVSPTATEQEIKKAYREKGKIYHADSNINLSQEEQEKMKEKFIEVHDAYKILSDKSKRSQFDLELAYHEYMKKDKVDLNPIFNFETNRGNVNVYPGMKKYSKTNKNDDNLKVVRKIVRTGKQLAKLMTLILLLVLVTKYSDEIKTQFNTVIDKLTEDESDIKTTEDLTEYKSIISLKRMYTVQAGDTLSELAEDANITEEELRNCNDMRKDDLLQYKAEIMIPYHITSDNLEYYTKTVPYEGNIKDFAEANETDVKTLEKLNKEAIIRDENISSVAIVLGDSLVVPNFITQEELALQKEITKQKTK